MTQNTQPGSSMPARGFPRRAFAQRSPRPRFRPVDTLWLTTLAILSLAATLIRFGVEAIGDIGAFAAAATVAGTYFIGWRVRDRATGVIAGTLLALSLTYSGSLIGHPVTAVFTLLSIAAFAAMTGGQLITAALLAAAASVIRPDGLLLGVALLCMPPPDDDSRQRWRPIGLFLLTTTLGALLAYSLHYTPPALLVGVTHTLLGQALLGGNAVLAWFLWPFLAELGEPRGRQRWLPFIAWTVLYIAAESLFYFVKGGQSWPPLAPIFALLVAGGMARLIPVLAGEFANPTLRYILATLAVVSLVAVRVSLDWPRAHLDPAPQDASKPRGIIIQKTPDVVPPSKQAPSTITLPPKPVPAIAMTPNPLPIVLTPQPSPTVAAPHPAIAPAPRPASLTPPAPATPTAPKPIAAPPAKPGAVPHHVVVVPREAVVANPNAPHIPESEGENNSVRTYIWKNGRLIKRSPWAINWDRKQQALAKQRETAAQGVAATPPPAAPVHTAPTPPVNLTPTHAPTPPVKPTPTHTAPAAVKPAPATHTPTARPTPAARPAATASSAHLTWKPAPVVHRAARRVWWRPQPRHRSIWAIRWEQAHRRKP